jgi:hypothetical protein
MTAAGLSTRELLLAFEHVGTSRRQVYGNLSDGDLIREMKLRIEAGLIPLRPWAVCDPDGAIVARYSCLHAAERCLMSGQSIRLEDQTGATCDGGLIA